MANYKEYKKLLREIFRDKTYAQLVGVGFSTEELADLMRKASIEEDAQTLVGICKSLDYVPPEGTDDYELYLKGLAETSQEIKYEVPGRTCLPKSKRDLIKLLNDFYKKNEGKPMKSEKPKEKDIKNKQTYEVSKIVLGILGKHNITTDDILPK